MTARRRLLRPPRPFAEPQRNQRRMKLEANLASERGSLSRWMVRLKRAFHAMEKLQRRIARLERQLRSSSS